FVAGTGDCDLVAAINRFRERPFAMKERDLVLLEQIDDAVVVLLDHGVLARQQLLQIELQVADLNAMVSEVVPRMLVVLARLQQRLAGDTADVGAGATRSRPALLVLPVVDASGVHSELRCANRGDVATRSAANNDDVECFVGHCAPQMSNSRRAGSSSASFIATSPSTASRPSMMRWS